MDPRQRQKKRLIALAFCAAGLVASTGGAAQAAGRRPPRRFTVFLAPTVASFSRASSDAELPVPEDWRARLEPPSPTMWTTTSSSLFAGGFLSGLALEPTLRLGHSAEVAVLVSYDDLWSGGAYGGCWLGYYVRGVTAHWWNPVAIAALRLQKPHPSIGLSVGVERWRLAVKFHRYQLLEEQFEGVDCSGCVNYWRLIEEHTRERGWGQRYAIAWQPLSGKLRLEVSHERNGNQITRWAFTIGTRFSLVRSREPEPTAPRPGPP